MSFFQAKINMRPSFTRGSPISSGYNSIQGSMPHDGDDDLSIDEEKPLANLDSIWKCEKIIKEDKKWTCTWCNKTYNNSNEARAIVHLSKLRLPVGQGQGFCTAPIPQKYHERYVKIAQEKSENFKAKQGVKREINTLAATDASRRGLQLTAQKAKRRKDYFGSNNFIHTKPSSEPLSEITNSILPTNVGSSFIQSRLHVDMDGNLDLEARNNTLDMAITNLIVCEGLPFRLAESPYLLQVINCSRKTNKNYQPPGRTQVSGPLLNLAYQDCIQSGREELLANSVGHHGLALLGDGATIKKMPMFNILIAGADAAPYVRRVVNCTDELREGHGKTGGRIGDKCLSVMTDLDPQRNLFDCCFFDGASNVQKAGLLLETEFPRVSVLHGAEHVVSLFFNDLFSKIPPIKKLVSQYRMLYKIFGAGCCHKAYALFTDFAQASTGKQIGLIRAADTRMAGYWYCFHRLLRLKNALIQTVSSPEWNDIKSPSLPKSKKIEIEDLCHQRVFFEAIKVLVATMYPVVKVLRLSDRNKAGMDKLYYATQRSTELLNKHVDALAHALNDFHVLEQEAEESDNETDDDSTASDSDDELPELRFYSHSDIKETIIDRWQLRKTSLEHDFAIVGWMCSIVPEIYNHCCNKNLRPRHYDAFERVARKLLWAPNIKTSSLDKLVCEAVDAHTKFRLKEGRYANKMMWESPYIEAQASHKWHQTFSGMYYCAFTKVACRVTSKILGIGSAERAWGDVKHLKQGKRSHLGHSSVEKQSIVYGQSCLKRAREKEEGRHDVWNFDDLEDQKILLELEEFMRDCPIDSHDMSDDDSGMMDDAEDIENARNNLFVTNVDDQRRIFKAYIEDIEKDIWLKRKHDDHYFYLKAKYKGMRYICPDDEKGYTIEDVVYYAEKDDDGKTCKYYAVQGRSKNSKCTENEKWDRVQINSDLHLQIRICQQSPDIKCVDESGFEVNRQTDIEENFYTKPDLMRKLKIGWSAMK